MSNTKPIPTVEDFNPDLPSVLTELQEGHYLFIIADSKKAYLLLFNGNKLEGSRDIMDPGVMQKIKTNSGELYGRNTKTMHHRDNQLRDHFIRIMAETEAFIQGKHLNGIFIGGHQPLFNKIKDELPAKLREVMRGTFVTELNIPREDLIKHCVTVLSDYEK